MSQYFGVLFSLTDYWTILYIIPSAFIAIWVHGFVHALVAQKYNCLEDKNEKVSKNPFKYISVFGFILMFAIGYGWSKTRKTKLDKLSKGQKVLVHIAGPLANFAASIAALLIQTVVLIIALYTDTETTAIVDAILFLLNMIIWANLLMCVSHLIPVPGFSGYNVLKTLFFEKYYNKTLAKLEENGKWLFVVLALSSILYFIAEIPTSYIYRYIAGAEEWFVDFVTNGLYSASSWTQD